MSDEKVYGKLRDAGAGKGSASAEIECILPSFAQEQRYSTAIGPSRPTIIAKAARYGFPESPHPMRLPDRVFRGGMNLGVGAGKSPGARPHITENLNFNDALPKNEHHWCDRLIEDAELQFRLGQFEAGENSLREVVGLVDDLRDDAARLTQIVRALPPPDWLGPGEANALGLLLAERGLVIEREDRSRRAVLMARLAAELSYTAETQLRSVDLAANAMHLVLEGIDTRTELYVRTYRDRVLRRPEQAGERVANAEQMLRIAIESGDRDGCWMAALAKAGALTMVGDIGGAQHSFEFARGIFHTVDSSYYNALSAACDVYNASLDGRFEEAIYEFGRCRELADSEAHAHVLDACWPSMLMPYAEQGRLAEIEGLAENAVCRRRNALIYVAFLSWIKVQRGSLASASFLLERLAAHDFAELANSQEGLVGMTMAAQVCAALDRPDYSLNLYRRLLPYSGLNATLSAVASFGSVARYLGILALTLGRLDEAITYFDDAVRIDRRNGARLCALYSGYELAAALVQRGAGSDCARASGLIDELEEEAKGLRMLSLEQKLGKTLSFLHKSHVTSSIDGSFEAALIEMATSDSSVEPTSQEQSNPKLRNKGRTIGELAKSFPPNNDLVASFCRQGEYWQVGYQGYTASLKHRRGLELISLLLRHPQRDFLAVELADEGGATIGVNTRRPAIESINEPVLDAAAKRAYRERIAELRAELKKLSEQNDHERAAKLEEEIDFLTRELARAIGLFGRDRKLCSEAERARKRVSIAIARAIRLISSHEQHFGRYLGRSIRTGNYCCYTPDPTNPVTWIL